MQKNRERAILHCDMNNFYASVECVLNPELKDKCLAVGGSVEERNGIILAKNYKAKAYGVETGEPIWQAEQKCKDLVVVRPQYNEYLKYSELARKIYGRYTDQIEPYGMDECWLDITGSWGMGTPYEIAEEIKETVKTELGLTISIGVSFNKVFAKLGSDLKKPDAITVLKREDFEEKIWHLKASELIGVGRKTERKLANVGIKTIKELADAEPSYLKFALGINGLRLKAFANGDDTSVVQRTDYVSPMKSIGHGTTTIEDLENVFEVWCIILHLTQDIGTKLRLHKKRASGIAITVKDNQLKSKEWQSQLKMPTQSSIEIAQELFNLFKKRYEWDNFIRSITVRVIGLIEDTIPLQADLFYDIKKQVKRESLDATIEKIRDKHGKQIIKNAVLFQNIKVSQNNNTGVIMPTGMIM